MILDFIKGISNWIIIALLVIAIMLGVVVKFQGSRIVSLREVNAIMASELLHTKQQLSNLNESHNKTIQELERVSKEREVLESNRKNTKQRIRDVIKDGKTDSTALTTDLSNSMWSAYCDGDSSSCPAK